MNILVLNPGSHTLMFQPKEMLVDVVGLEGEYLERWPDVADPNQLVSFGTSGHRGSPDLCGDL
jgi:hypothetical protein